MDLKTLPQQLTTNEEKKYLELMLISQDKKAREILINHNLRLVAFIIHKFFKNSKMEYDDLFSIGIIGLVKGVDNFSLEKNSKLSTFVSVCIKNEILQVLRKNNKNIVNISASLDENVGNKGENNYKLKDVIADKKDDIAEMDEKMDTEIHMSKVNKILSKTDQKKKKIFEKVWGINGEKKLRQAQIEKECGHSQSYVSRINNRILKEIKKEMTMN